MNKYKGPTNVWLTMGLFGDILLHQHRLAPDMDRVLYWLEDRKIENDPRPIFKDLYLQLRDTTGVKAAKLYLGGYDHFEYLMDKSDWFREAVERWNRELEATFRSEALVRVQELADGAAGEAVKLAANKFLATKEYNKDKTNKRGRPTAKEVEGELKRQARSSESLNSDFQRMKGN